MSRVNGYTNGEVAADVPNPNGAKAKTSSIGDTNDYLFQQQYMSRVIGYTNGEVAADVPNSTSLKSKTFSIGDNNDDLFQQRYMSSVNGYPTSEVVANLPNSNSEKLQRDQFLLAFSAHNESTLRSNIAAIRDKCENYHLIDLAYTLGVRRSRFSSRSFVVAKLKNVRKRLDYENIIPYKVQSSQSNRLGFIFTGKWSNYL